MFVISFTGLTTSAVPFLTDIDGTEPRLFEDAQVAAEVCDLFTPAYGARVDVASETPHLPNWDVVAELIEEEETQGRFTAKRDEDSGSWRLWNSVTGKWDSTSLNSRDEARKLAKILNSQKS
jgi:muconolactone delta-isomerase